MSNKQFVTMALIVTVSVAFASTATIIKQSIEIAQKVGWMAKPEQGRDAVVNIIEKKREAE